jgi:hypothetical protein
MHRVYAEKKRSRRSRVTRFRPLANILFLGQFYNYVSSQNILGRFLHKHSRVCALNFDQKMGGAILGDFSRRKHLVTLRRKSTIKW